MRLEKEEKYIRRSGTQIRSGDQSSTVESTTRRSRSLSLMLGLALATSFALQSAGPAEAGRGQERRAEQAAQENNEQAQHDANHAVRAARHDARQDARSDNRQAQFQANQQAKAQATAEANRRDAARSQYRNNVRDDRRSAQSQVNHHDSPSWDNIRDHHADNSWRDDRNHNSPSRAYHRPSNRWDSSLSNKARYQTYRKYRNNWSDQRTYLHANLSRFNQLAALDRQQQQALDAQMQAAYLAYNNNHYNGSYNWDVYSNPQFLDYLQTRKPSLLQNILSAIGLGGTDNYLYSSNWNDERSQLAQNMSRIHQLAASGRITPAQEQNLISQLRTEFMAYQNNSYSGNPTWTQYSDPGFVDYLNNRKPSVLMTVRDYLVR